MWGFLIAMISGALMSIQGVFNTGASKQSGTWLINCFVQLTGFLVCIFLYLFLEQGKIPVGDLWKIKPKYMLLGGIIGVFITFTVIKSMSILGPAKAILAIVVTQIIMGYFIEIFGLFGVEKISFSLIKLMGIIISILGIVIFNWKK